MTSRLIFTILLLQVALAQSRANLKHSFRGFSEQLRTNEKDEYQGPRDPAVGRRVRRCLECDEDIWGSLEVQFPELTIVNDQFPEPFNIDIPQINLAAFGNTRCTEGTKGEQGPPGIRGATGPRGYTGIRGERGLAGPKGEPGLTGPRGYTGITGPQGAPGSMGPPGLTGPRGPPGIDGVQGPPGSKGARGSRGFDGIAGSEGLSGIKGDKGERGLPGIGVTGPIGPPGPPGPGNNETWFALLGACREQRKVPSLVDGGKSFGNDRIDQECQEFITTAYEQMNTFFQNPTKPDVQEISPPKTCKDLFIADPEKPSGEYQIDPNGGDSTDAILVKCNADKRSTCITPDQARSPNVTYDGIEEEVWLSEIENGMQITYADSNQINALQSLSRHAEQTVTYHCLRSVGYLDGEDQSYDRGLKLSAWTEIELTPRGRQRLRYNVTLDECQDRLDEWRKTVITYKTDRPVLLPVVDVGLRDVGEPDHSFSVEIGEVCFD